jgi:hypothetical protein
MIHSSITEFIHFFRSQQVKSKLHRGLVQLAIGSIIFLFAMGLLESVFYFTIPVRLKTAEFFLLLFCTAISFICLRWLFHYKSFFKNSSNEFLAQNFEKRNPKIGDRLLNALQLEKLLDDLDKGKDLAEFAVSKLNTELKNISRESLYDPVSKSLKKTVRITLISAVIILLLLINSLPHAFQRLLQPSKDFPVPLPFVLNSMTGNLEVLGGDTLTISVAGFGELPDSIHIHWEDKDKSGTAVVAQKNEIYHYTFTGVKRDTRYWAEFKSPSWFSAWESITTNPDTIFVTDRPIVQELQFTVLPPVYTNEGEFQHPGNITDISIPEGSRVRLKGKSSKTLDSAWIFLDEIANVLSVQGNKLNGTFYIKNKTNAAIYVQDENGVRNLHPPNYRFSIIPDSPPDLIVQSPNRKFELDESDLIGFDIQTSDDYGFSNAWLEYRVKAPDYLPQDTTLYTRNIAEIQRDVKSQQLYHEWDISEFSLAPEDELHIQVIIADNNTLSGPSLTYSPILIGRFPSLEDLFKRMEEEEAEVEEYGEEIQMNLEDVRELVEELELELLKSENVSWEQEQKAAEALEKMDAVFDQIEQIKETMQKIQEQAEQNNLVSDDLIEKFSQFQELLDEIMTPEMLAAMEKLQEAMEEMDPQKMLDALENFEFDLAAFEEQLDRFIEMFELALAEQKMDEVVKRLEKLAEEQEAIMEELSKDEDLATLASRERRQEESFKTLEQAMKDAAKAMETLSPDASQQLSDLAQSELTESTASDLNEARTEMQNKNSSGASQSGGKASSGLNEMLEIAQEIRSEFQEDTVDELLRKFLALIRNLLYISQEQENLVKETEGLRSRSPKLIETAVKQDKILRENQQFMIQLTELSRETFHISPQIAGAIGRTKTAMDRTISRLEQKQTSSAKKEMKKILKGLNEIAKLLLESANQMQMSGSGSGMAEFMERMEEMSKQQQGINQGTMNLPQLGMMAQQQMMEQLQKQQEELKKQLEELLGENPGQENSGAGKAKDEMEEVIEDFRRKQVDRRTQDRQQRILSRMLDSQKSLTQKDYSEKRKSSGGEEFIFSGPTGLPTDMGEREMLLINAMESALQEGHSREYQNMMKQYFRSLQRGDELINE